MRARAHAISPELCPSSLSLPPPQYLISDEIPCYGGSEGKGGGPIFSKARHGELWVPLLEKAWAKAFGTYQHTIGGHSGETMTNLTGAPCTFVPTAKADIWQQIYRATANDPGVRLLLISAVAPPSPPPPLIFSASPISLSFEQANAHGWFVCATISRNAAAKFFKQPTDAQAVLGLVEGHAYSVLDAKQINGGASLSARYRILVRRGVYSRTCHLAQSEHCVFASPAAVELVQLRNPWGNGMEWSVPWLLKGENRDTSLNKKA